MYIVVHLPGRPFINVKFQWPYTKTHYHEKTTFWSQNVKNIRYKSNLCYYYY